MGRRVNVIGVGMGEQHRIQFFYIGPQHLVPEIGRGIYYNGCGFTLHQDAGT